MFGTERMQIRSTVHYSYFVPPNLNVAGPLKKSKVFFKVVSKVDISKFVVTEILSDENCDKITYLL